jgi:triosephosphate isomerase
MSKKIFAANWKLHKTPKETRDFFTEFKGLLSGLGSGGKTSSMIVFFPPATSLEAAAQSLSQEPAVEWGSQNSYFEGKGAFTGEVSAAVVKELGGQWVLLGHSERRKIFSETDELVAAKLAYVQSLGLKPMLCIGETLEERESGKTAAVLRLQIEKCLSKALTSKLLAVAYEPVWAIGTGKVASSTQVKETHQVVRTYLSQLGFSVETPILYGGSVKADNAKELIQIPNVDGFLVGGASLEPKNFMEICKCL